MYVVFAKINTLHAIWQKIPYNFQYKYLYHIEIQM